jgi:hypothetical protein
MKNVRLRNEKYRTSVEIFLQRDCDTIVTIVSDLASDAVLLRYIRTREFTN